MCATWLWEREKLSWLDYCNVRYVDLPWKLSWKLKLTQHVATHLLTGSIGNSHVTPLLEELHWLPPVFRAQFKVLIITLVCD